MPQTLLNVPVGPDDHRAGADSAPITLVEYGDYQCSYCTIAFQVVGQLQRRFGDDLRLLRYAALAGVDGGAFTAALTSEAVLARIEADVDGAIASGVGGTPTFFVNGVRHDGSWDFEPLADRLQAELR